MPHLQRPQRTPEDTVHPTIVEMGEGKTSIHNLSFVLFLSQEQSENHDGGCEDSHPEGYCTGRGHEASL